MSNSSKHLVWVFLFISETVDKRRPFLQTPGKTSYSNYINACFVTSYRKKDAFIATQSPLPNSVEDFWRLVYDWKCPLIVMLNQLDPRDKTCCKYWPENNSSQFGNMNVTLKEEQNVGIYVHRQFELINTYNQEQRLVHHMHLNSWDEKNQQDLIILIRDMEKIQQDYSMVAPTVVHCINGVGLTGVFLTVKSEMERMITEGCVDVFHTVRQLRRSNHCMVYTEEDYYLCHQLLKLEFPESHYANI
ncbi:Receptor-type tyrosine-protein phosphatase alpha [Holothuria leucospilota]|uniref:protein-tyrosine-phosphatase n=1 Tax=Holothuria leucospilota TaxID=206669 RepID=A0A9Q1BBR2_HOLLE|nr:Receptor-type tyrosine-protein phosphatase alpha [Holothuria leucospilota]